MESKNKKKRSFTEFKDKTTPSNVDVDIDTDIDIDSTVASLLTNQVDKQVCFLIVKDITKLFLNKNCIVLNSCNKQELLTSKIYNLKFKDINVPQFGHSEIRELRKRYVKFTREIWFYWNQKDIEMVWEIHKHESTISSNFKIRDQISTGSNKEFLKKILNWNPEKKPQSWEVDKISLSEIVFMFYNHMEENKELVPEISFELEIDNNKNCYLLSIKNLDRISNSFLEMIQKYHKKTEMTITNNRSIILMYFYD